MFITLSRCPTVFRNRIERTEMKNWKNDRKPENNELRMKAFFECETPYKYKIQVSTFGFRPALWITDRYFMYSFVCRSRILSWFFSSNTLDILGPLFLILGLIGGEIFIMSGFIYGGFGLACVLSAVQCCTLSFTVHTSQFIAGCRGLIAVWQNLRRRIS